MATVIYTIHKLETACPTTGGDSLRDDRERAHLTLGEKWPHGRSRGFINLISVCHWMSDFFSCVYFSVLSKFPTTQTHIRNKCEALRSPFLSPLPATPTVTQFTASRNHRRVNISKV